MNSASDRGGRSSETSQRGLYRLMLRLPALRGHLQMIAAKTDALNDLFEAYDEAATALERFQKSASPLSKEFELACTEIEADIIKYVLDRYKASNS